VTVGDHRFPPPVANSFSRLRYGSDAASEWFYFLQGFFATLAVLYPLFGPVFTPFGYHHRIIASTLMGIVAVASFTRFSVGRARNALLASGVLVLALAFLHADPLQREYAFRVQFDVGYYNGKLARMFQIFLPILVFAYLVSASRRQAAFVRGTWWAILVCGLIGISIHASHAEYFLGQTSREVHAFMDEGTFSPASLSIVISLSAILLLERIPWKGQDFAWLTVLGLAQFFAVLLLRQRTHLIMLAVLVLMKFWTERTKLFSLVAVTIAFAIGVDMIVTHYREYVITETVRHYWQAAASGLMFRTRFDLAIQAMEGIRQNALGHGLGSFSLDHFNKYPHNCVLEAFYELGVLGALCVGFMCLTALRHIRGLFARQRNGEVVQSTWFLHAAVVFLLAHVLKSGSLEHIGSFAYFLFIAPEPRPLGKRFGRWTWRWRADVPNWGARVAPELARPAPRRGVGAGRPRRPNKTAPHDIVVLTGSRTR
jgi:hypothetical protein